MFIGVNLLGRSRYSDLEKETLGYISPLYLGLYIVDPSAQCMAPLSHNLALTFEIKNPDCRNGNKIRVKSEITAADGNNGAS